MARDATLQLLIGGHDYAARVIRERAGKAFDPAVVAAVLADGVDALDIPASGSVWDEVLRLEPQPAVLVGPEVDRALAAVGDFADLMSPYFVGHSSGVAQLAADAATASGSGRRPGDRGASSRFDSRPRPGRDQRGGVGEAW